MSEALRKAIKPPTDLVPWKWAGENVRIANSERSPKYDADQTPWWKAPSERAADISTRQIVVIAPTGSGKSTFYEGLIPYCVAENPGPMLYASQTDSDAGFWSETRLIPALKSCSAVKELWPKDRHKMRKNAMIFPHMPIEIVGANPSSFQESSVRWLFGDEVWAWKPPLLREFQARHHNRWNRKEYLVSQGGVSGDEDENGEAVGGDELWQEWMKTDRAEFGWKCKCGEAQPFNFEFLKYDKVIGDEGNVDIEATAKTCRLECRSCGHTYQDTVKNRRHLASSNMDNGDLGYIPTNPHGIEGRRGYRIDSLAIWWVPWADEVMGYLEAIKMMKAGSTEKLRQFTQKRRADFWKDDLGDSTAEIASNGDYSKTDHEDGALIEGEIGRFMTVDVGGDHYWAVIAAWESGGRPTVLWEGYIPSDGADESELKRLGEQYNVKPQLHFIDIGFEQDRILDLCAKHGWTGIKGDGNHTHFRHKDKKEKLYSPMHRHRAKSGGVARFILIASNPVKDILARMVANQQISLPADISKPFLSHMKCEKRQAEIDPQTGAEKVKWIRPHSRANHLWDCMCYQVAAGLIMNCFDS
jgi:phage terminase large subunit GpA-like protein